MTSNQLLTKEARGMEITHDANLYSYVLTAKDSGSASTLEKQMAIAGQNIAAEHAGLLGKSQSKAKEFYRKVISIALSDRILAKLSSDVGVPSSDESEDEFVKRAKDAFRKILWDRLSQ